MSSQGNNMREVLPAIANSKVSVVGAFDRHNYGDLLFPLIVERAALELGVQAQLDYYATSVSIMSSFGGKDTKDVRQLFAQEASAEETVLIAGGEVLPAKWSLIVSYLVNPFWARVINRLSTAVGDRWASKLISSCLGSGSELPFVYAASDFSRPVRVVYNAVGGSHIKDESAYIRRTLINKLGEADYISVRDSETQKFLISQGLQDVRLSPDCAVLLSKLYPVHVLDELITDHARSLVLARDRGYICVQAAAAYIRGNEDAFRRNVCEIAKRTGLNVVVFAIGRATGHSDQQTFDLFRSVSELAAGQRIIVSDCTTVHDLMWLIANSRAYIGTSLHGAITAASYGVPVLGLCPSRVNKLQAFLNTWVDPLGFRLAEFADLGPTFDLLWGSAAAASQERIKEAQAIAMDNFRAMFRVPVAGIS